MKRKKSYLIIAILIAMLSSCNNDSLPLVDNVTDTPIRVNTMIAGMNSRAGYEGQTSLPESFYLKIENPQSVVYSYDALMKNENSKWNSYTADNKSALMMLWQNSKTDVNVKAATFSMSNNIKEIEVGTDQNSEEKIKANDHLYMKNNAQGFAAIEATDDIPSKNEGEINVTFSHIMSKVIINITLNNEFNEVENPITDMILSGTYQYGDFYIPEEEIGYIYKAQDGYLPIDITPFESKYTPQNDQDILNAKAQYEAILLPQKVNEKKFSVTFKINNRIFQWISADALTFKSGYLYTLNLTAGNNAVNSVGISSALWTENDTSISKETE